METAEQIDTAEQKETIQQNMAAETGKTVTVLN